MRLNIQDQKALDIAIKELRIKHQLLREDVYTISPDVRAYMDNLSKIIILLYEQSN